MFCLSPMKNKTRLYIHCTFKAGTKKKKVNIVCEIAQASQWSSLFLEITRKHSTGLHHCCARNRLHCSKLYLYCCWTVQNNSWTVTLFKTFEAQQGSNLLRASHSHEMPLLHNQQHKLPNFQQISFRAFTNNKCCKNGFTIYHTCFHFVLLI